VIVTLFFWGIICENSWFDYSWFGPVWLTYSIIFSIAFFGITVISGYNFKKNFKYSRCTLNTTNIAYIFLLCGAFLRCIYLAVDPHGSREIFNDVIERLLIGSMFPIIISIYCIILFFWIEVYNRTVDIFNTFLNRLKIPFLLISIISFSIEISFDILIGLQKQHHNKSAAKIFLLALLSFLLFMAITVITGFLVYGSLLYSRLSKTTIRATTAKKERMLYLTNITRSATIVVIIAIVGIIWWMASDYDNNAVFYVTFVSFGRCEELALCFFLVSNIRE